MNIRITLTVLAIVMSGIAAQAQISAGIKAGGTLTKFSDHKVAPGYLGGVFAEYSITEFFSIRGEGLYVSYATKLDDYSRDLSNVSLAIKKADYKNRSLRFHAVQIPVMVQYTLPFAESIRPTIYAGGAYTYNVAVFHNSDNTYYLEEGQTEKYQAVSDNVNSEFKEYDISVLGGFSLNINRISLDARYQRGFQDLNTLNVNGKYKNQDYNSSIVSLSVGLKLYN